MVERDLQWVTTRAQGSPVVTLVLEAAKATLEVLKATLEAAKAILEALKATLEETKATLHLSPTLHISQIPHTTK